MLPAATAIHSDGNVLFVEQPGKFHARELVCPDLIEDMRLGVAGDGFLHRLNAEIVVSVLCNIKLPGAEWHTLPWPCSILRGSRYSNTVDVTNNLEKLTIQASEANNAPSNSA